MLVLVGKFTVGAEDGLIKATNLARRAIFQGAMGSFSYAARSEGPDRDHPDRRAANAEVNQWVSQALDEADRILQALAEEHAALVELLLDQET